MSTAIYGVAEKLELSFCGPLYCCRLFCLRGRF